MLGILPSKIIMRMSNNAQQTQDVIQITNLRLNNLSSSTLA